MAFHDCARSFLVVIVFSLFINMLYLNGSLYMMHVYDRVLTSRSLPTLGALSLIALAGFALQGVLDAVRARMLARIGARFDQVLAPRVHQAVAERPLAMLRAGGVATPMRDLDQVRGFLSGPGPTALFDMPFVPFFALITCLLHPWLGLLTIFGMVAIIVLAALTELRSQAPTRALTDIAARRFGLAETTRRNAEVIVALGMRERFQKRLKQLGERHVAETLRASDVLSGIGAVAKTFRFALQSAALGLGAYLVIQGELSAGAILAASILISRALAPIETAVANWKGFVSARQSFRRLEDRLATLPHDEPRFSLAAPTHRLLVEDLVVAPPARERPVLNGVSMRLASGDAVGVLGQTGCGKSTLARALAGIWRARKGCITLDGAALEQWGDQLGRHVGYLPQDVELFDGTVAENISRFAEASDPAAILAAAKAAAAHELILDLPAGYDTPIGESGAALSGGQRQRVALARALYGDPFLVVLDEPNANLDTAGEDALNMAIRSVRARGGVAVVITHRLSGLAAVNLVAVIDDGVISAFGPRDSVLQRLRAVPDRVAHPVKAVAT